MEPSTAASATNELLKLGLAGVVILGLVAVCVVLWRSGVAERKESAATIKELQESRLADTRKQTEAFVNATVAMNTMKEVVEQLDGSLRTMIAESQARRTR